MAGLKNRLKLLRKQSGVETNQIDQTPQKSVSLSERFHRSRPRTSSQTPTKKIVKIDDQQIAELLNGQVVSEGLIEIARTFPLSYKQGHFELGGALNPVVVPIYKTSNFQAEKAIFLDLETTGLAGGTGTLAFLTGLGFFKNGSFKVVLYLITSFAAERKMLEAVSKRVNGLETIVSFNGKSFDGPLLSTRYRLAGMADPLAGLGHLDLLHPARRAFKNVWPDCRLQSVEKSLMGFMRKNDLPGSEVPEVWLNLVRRGQTDKLRAVVKHNGLDILSLAALLPALQLTYQQPGKVGARVVDIARAYQKHNDLTTGFSLLEAHRSLLDRDGLLELAKYYRREKNWEQAVEIWSTLAQKGDSEALQSLAKYEEHVTRNFDSAIQYTDELIRVSGSLPEHNHRKERVQAKIGARAAL
jgi:uncharacterized protein